MKTAASDRIAEPHRSSVKISEHGEQKLHKLLMQDKSPKPKISIYTYWKLVKAGNSNSLIQYAAPQALIDRANFWTAVWLYKNNLT